MPEFEPGNNNKEFEVETIPDSAVHAKKADGHLTGLYYFVEWKGYPKERNTWKLFLAVMHLQKLVSTFHMDHLEKPSTTSALPDSAPPMAKPTVKPTKLFK